MIKDGEKVECKPGEDLAWELDPEPAKLSCSPFNGSGFCRLCC